MKITDALLGEHAIFYELFSDVRETAENSNDLHEILKSVSILERLLISHARVEDELLFPQLEPSLGPMGPLAVMRSEHQQLEQLLETCNAETDVSALKSVINQLLELALAHFRKEEMVLFAMAQQVLGDQALLELGDSWAERRGVMINGQGCSGAA